MAVSIFNNLYPPVTEARQTAFIRTNGAKLYFNVSNFNTTDSIAYVQLRAYRQDNGSAILDKDVYPEQIKTYSFQEVHDVLASTQRTGDENYPYAITLEPIHLKDSSFEINQYYKFQIRFITENDIIKTHFLKSNLNYVIKENQSGQERKLGIDLKGSEMQDIETCCSEWSNITIIRAISQPSLVFDTFNIDKVVNLWGAVTLRGEMVLEESSSTSNTSIITRWSQDEEHLKCYRIKVYHYSDWLLRELDKNIIEDSNWIYSDIYKNNPNLINYDFKYDFLRNNYYKIEVEAETSNGYELNATFNFCKMQDFASYEDLLIFEEPITSRGFIKVTVASAYNMQLYGSYTIQRTSSESNYEVWEDLKTFTLNSTDSDGNAGYYTANSGLDTLHLGLTSKPYVFYDNTIKSNVFYKYGVQKRDVFGNRYYRYTTDDVYYSTTWKDIVYEVLDDGTKTDIVAARWDEASGRYIPNLSENIDAGEEEILLYSLNDDATIQTEPISYNEDTLYLQLAQQLEGNGYGSLTNNNYRPDIYEGGAEIQNVYTLENAIFLHHMIYINTNNDVKSSYIKFSKEEFNNFLVGEVTLRQYLSNKFLDDYFDAAVDDNYFIYLRLTTAYQPVLNSEDKICLDKDTHLFKFAQQKVVALSLPQVKKFDRRSVWGEGDWKTHFQYNDDIGYHSYAIAKSDINDTLYEVAKEHCPLLVDFDSILLTRENQQLSIILNPEISSFQRKKNQVNIETIGSKYPFIYESGTTDYKTFSIGGMISYHDLEEDIETSLYDADFIPSTEDVFKPGTIGWIGSGDSISTYKNGYVDSTTKIIDNADEQYYNDLLSLIDLQLFNNSTMVASDYKQYRMENDITDLYDDVREREFREQALNFLYKDEPVLLRSLAEGNIIVKLTDISFTPNNQLGRLVWDFSATAYEICEYNYDNLLKFGFHTVGEYTNEAQYYKKIDKQFTLDVPARASVKDMITNQLCSYYGYDITLSKFHNISIEILDVIKDDNKRSVYDADTEIVTGTIKYHGENLTTTASNTIYTKNTNFIYEGGTLNSGGDSLSNALNLNKTQLANVNVNSWNTDNEDGYISFHGTPMTLSVVDEGSVDVVIPQNAKMVYSDDLVHISDIYIGNPSESSTGITYRVNIICTCSLSISTDLSTLVKSQYGTFNIGNYNNTILLPDDELKEVSLLDLIYQSESRLRDSNSSNYYVQDTMGSIYDVTIDTIPGTIIKLVYTDGSISYPTTYKVGFNQLSLNLKINDDDITLADIIISREDNVLQVPINVNYHFERMFVEYYGKGGDSN